MGRGNIAGRHELHPAVTAIFGPLPLVEFDVDQILTEIGGNVCAVYRVEQTAYKPTIAQASLVVSKQFVRESWRLQVHINDDHAFTDPSSESGDVGQRQCTSRATLIAVEDDSLHRWLRGLVIVEVHRALGSPWPAKTRIWS